MDGLVVGCGDNDPTGLARRELIVPSVGYGVDGGKIELAKQ